MKSILAIILILFTPISYAITGPELAVLIANQADAELSWQECTERVDGTELLEGELKAYFTCAAQTSDSSSCDDPSAQIDQTVELNLTYKDIIPADGTPIYFFVLCHTTDGQYSEWSNVVAKKRNAPKAPVQEE